MLFRSSALGPARILLPMVSTKAEVVRCREVLSHLIQDLRESKEPHDPNVQLGVMVEVPVVVPILSDILPLVDFLSVGTNDLVQYLLAVDRGNQRVASLYEPCHPAVVRTLVAIFGAARQRGIPAAVCGELGGDPLWAPLLVGLGVRELSMSPAALPEVRFVLRHSASAELRELAAKVVASADAAKTRGLLQDFAAAKLKLR